MKRRFCLKVPFGFPNNEQTHLAVQYHLGRHLIAKKLLWPYQSWSNRFLRFMFSGSLRCKLSYSDLRILAIHAKHEARLDKSKTIRQCHIDKAWDRVLERKRSDSELSEDEKERRRERMLSMLRIGISLGGIGLSFYSSSKSMALQKKHFDKNYASQE